MYPCLMKSACNTVWMTSSKHGIVIETKGALDKPGDPRKDWIMSVFKKIENPSRDLQIKLGKMLLQGKLNDHG